MVKISDIDLNYSTKEQLKSYVETLQDCVDKLCKRAPCPPPVNNKFRKHTVVISFNINVHFADINDVAVDTFFTDIGAQVPYKNVQF